MSNETKLNTLKTLTTCIKRTGTEGTTCSNCGSNHTFTEEILQLEAARWVTEFEKGELWTNFIAYQRTEQENIIEWIKEFFNLKGKDLR